MLLLSSYHFVQDAVLWLTSSYDFLQLASPPFLSPFVLLIEALKREGEERLE
jgi:hypothetical protein